MPTDVLAFAVAWLDGVRNASMAETVTYSAQGAPGFTVSATRGETTLPVEDDGGVQLKLRKWDWIISVSQFAEQTQPKPGDQIIEADGTVHEVAAPAKGESHWRWHEKTKLSYRIHTQQIAPTQ